MVFLYQGSTVPVNYVRIRPDRRSNMSMPEFTALTWSVTVGYGVGLVVRIFLAIYDFGVYRCHVEDTGV